MMITITNYNIRSRKDGTPFVTLEVTGGLEFIQSSTTGKFYATVRKCSIPCTFDELVAKSLIGSTMPGQIVRVEAEAYEYTNPRTGEVMILQHTYAYQPEGSAQLIGHTFINELEAA